MVYMVLGAVLLFFTYLDYKKDEADTLFVLEWLPKLDISRVSHPLPFWLILLIQASAGAYLVYAGWSSY